MYESTCFCARTEIPFEFERSDIHHTLLLYGVVEMCGEIEFGV
jgi:hypothetical protein